jgi:hypothetical protein
MQTKVKSEVTMSMEVGEDCIVFASRCLCHGIRKNGTVMVEHARRAGMSKVVVVGDCDDHGEWHEEVLSEVMLAAGLEHIWLADDCLSIEHAMPNFSPTAVRKFDDAKSFGELRKSLDKMGRRISDIAYKIKSEADTLAKYPIVGKIQAIESHDHNCRRPAGTVSFEALFGSPSLPDRLISEVRAVALLNLETNEGLLVTPSQEISFVLARPKDFDLEIFQGRSARDLKHEGYTIDGYGSVRIDVGEGATEISLYCYPGVWKIAPHRELNTLDVNEHYTPMCQRVEASAV